MCYQKATSVAQYHQVKDQDPELPSNKQLVVINKTLDLLRLLGNHRVVSKEVPIVMVKAPSNQQVKDRLAVVTSFHHRQIFSRLLDQ